MATLKIIVQRLKKMSTLIDKIGKRKDKRSGIVVSWKFTNFGKKSYPNFFTDTRHFIRFVDRILYDYNKNNVL